ncbi:MAG TPA: type II toxin-antitoxin system PemK/MazF family toxin [archaeon]|nr:type II toxin-antitoxin system PemK/MazF family toxin [archaeon]
MEQRDIVWIKLPFSNFEGEKIRPGLVVSNDSYNSKNPDIVICAITSKLEERPYSVPLYQKNLREGNLPVESRIKADKIMQVEKSRVIRPFAKLSNETFQLVVSEIKRLIGTEK